MRPKRRLIVAIGGFGAAVLALFVANLVAGSGYGARFLRAEVHEVEADIGIPGVSRVYSALLVNDGWLPTRVKRCDFVDDASAPGRMLAYAVQRWDEQTKRWQNVAELNSHNFCKPYPLGIVESEVTWAWLWPGDSLAGGEEATAARDGFKLGDHARFVVFLGDAGDYQQSIATDAFIITEQPTTSLRLRLKH